MMISDDLRILLYPLGVLSTALFALRFIIQWIGSEKAGQSIVTASFWQLSLLGNSALGLHSFIQGQYPICIVQALNGVIACRNLNLMGPLEQQWKFRSVVASLFAALLLPTLLFWVYSPDTWLRIPSHPFQSSLSSISSFWHLIGILGVVLFASRFWVQWIQAEQFHKSSLQRPFWWLSLIGAFLSLIYFARILDYVNLLGPLFGLIPYGRNLMLLRRTYAEK